tara:strand:+ start:357 stop:566 length:210 start_codon:yes stop_codon:yes gene_type:complete
MNGAEKAFVKTDKMYNGPEINHLEFNTKIDDMNNKTQIFSYTAIESYSRKVKPCNKITIEIIPDRLFFE